MDCARLHSRGCSNLAMLLYTVLELHTWSGGYKGGIGMQGVKRQTAAYCRGTAWRAARQCSLPTRVAHEGTHAPPRVHRAAVAYKVHHTRGGALLPGAAVTIAPAGQGLCGRGRGAREGSRRRNRMGARAGQARGAICGTCAAV